jgi:cell division protein FtsQ
MDRSLAGRPPTGRLGGPFATWRTARARRRSGRPRSGPISLWEQLPAAVLTSTRRGAALVWRRRRLRIALLAVLVALPPLAGGWLWLRHSPLVAVEHVQISGVHGAQAAGIERALEGAARHMSTLDVQLGALHSAVAAYPVVREIRARASFPHGLRIHVVEQPPVAVLVAGVQAGSGSTGGDSTAVAADGAVLGATLVSTSLPVIHISAATLPGPGGHVNGAAVRAELTVLGAAPGTLLGWVQHVFMGPEGLTVEMRDGLSIYFGNATRPHAKWLAAARVLSDHSSAGASYVDVRLPERPAAGTTAAGGLEGVSSQHDQVSATDPTAAALAATLDEAVSGGAGASSAPATSSEAASTGTSTEASPVAAGATGAVGAGAPAATTGEAPASASENSTTEPSISTSG